MKQLSNLRNVAAVFAFVVVATLAMLALSPKAFAAPATEITIGSGAAINLATGTLPANMSYDNATNTLTLNNYSAINAISINGDITIHVSAGSTNIITDHDAGGRALYVDGNLTLTGSGSLTVNGHDAVAGSYDFGSTAISCTGTITIDGPTIIANGGDTRRANNAGAHGVFLPNGSLNILSGTVEITGGDGFDGAGGDGVYALNGVIISGGTSVEITGGNANASGTKGASGGSGVDGNVEIHADATTVDISGGSGLGIEGAGGGDGVRGNVTISKVSTKTIKITGGPGVPGSPDRVSNGGDGISGNLTTPTGIISPSIDIEGGMGTKGLPGFFDGKDGKQYGGSHFSLSNPPQPTQTSQVQPQQQPAQDVIYPTSQTGTTRGVYTFSSSGMFSDFSGIWIHGFAIPSSYYTAFQNADGSVSITLADWYVRTLNYGEEYLIHFVFNSGYGITKFYR